MGTVTITITIIRAYVLERSKSMCVLRNVINEMTFQLHVCSQAFPQTSKESLANCYISKTTMKVMESDVPFQHSPCVFDQGRHRHLGLPEWEALQALQVYFCMYSTQGVHEQPRRIVIVEETFFKVRISQLPPYMSFHWSGSTPSYGHSCK